MTIGKWADCVGHPSGAALKAAGFTGVFLYVGTPGRAKNVTGPIYRDYVLSGLQVACVYENTADDISSGAGAAHAQAAVADMRSMGMPDSTPLAAAADEHLTAGQIPTAVSYQAQFHAAARDAGWSGPVGGYGFSEFTHATSVAQVAEWLWQCGSASVLWPAVTFWQRNTGTTTVGGTQVDINDQFLPISVDPAGPQPATFPATPDDEESTVLVPAGTDHVTLITHGKSRLVLGCGFTDQVTIHSIDGWGTNASGWNAVKVGVGGHIGEFQLNPDEPLDIPLQNGEVLCSISYTANHSFAAGAV